MSAVFTGRLEDSVTSQLLQEAGLSPYTAGLMDNGLSIAGSMGGVAAIHPERLAALPNYKLPASSTLPVMERNGWVLPKNGGGAFIHGRWYSAWENRDIETFLGAMASWIEDMDGFYINQGLPIPEKPDWKVFADILMGGKVYE